MEITFPNQMSVFLSRMFFVDNLFNTLSDVLATYLGVCNDGTLDAISPMRFRSAERIQLHVDCGGGSLLVVEQQMTSVQKLLCGNAFTTAASSASYNWGGPTMSLQFWLSGYYAVELATATQVSCGPTSTRSRAQCTTALHCSGLEACATTTGGSTECICTCSTGLTGATCNVCDAGHVTYPTCTQCTTAAHCSGHAGSVVSNADKTACVCSCSLGQLPMLVTLVTLRTRYATF